MKKEIISLKVYVSLLTILYIAMFCYVIIAGMTLNYSITLMGVVVIFNIITNVLLLTNEEVGLKLVLPLAIISLSLGAVTINVIALVGSVVMFIGIYRLHIAHHIENGEEEITLEEPNLETGQLLDTIVDGYITQVIFDPTYQGEKPYSIEIEYHLGNHIYSFIVGGFDRDITIDLDMKNLRNIPVFLQHGSPDLAQIDEEALRYNIDN